MFDWDMSDDALNSYEQDAKDIHTSARVLRLIKQVRDHRKEIERQAALIERAKSLIHDAIRCYEEMGGYIGVAPDEHKWLKDAEESK